jgi:hypothetical protein
MMHVFLLFSFVAVLVISSQAVQAEWKGPPIDGGLMAEVPDGADIRILFDYGLKYRRKWWMSWAKRWSPTHHNGIDFVRIRTPDVNSPVLSASIGKVVYSGANACDGGVVIVRTPFKVPRRERTTARRVYVVYAHLAKVRVKRGQKVQHGVKIGVIGPPGKPCVGSRAHLHFALTHSLSDTQRHAMNPNRFWTSGSGKVSCFRDSDKIPTNRLVLTSPLSCFPDAKLAEKAAGAKPAFEGNIHELASELEKADKETVKKWQSYFKLFGHYRGSVDGVYGKNTKIGAMKCAWDTRCAK